MTENSLQKLQIASSTAASPAPVSGEPPRAGGPQTADGKLASRGNALRHGLTAQKLLPDVLQPGRLERYLALFEREYQPATPTEYVLIAELARHASALELGEAAEGAVLQQGARELAPMIVGVAASEFDRKDALLAAAVATETLDRFSRYRRAHEKAFLGTLSKLRELEAAKRSPRAQQLPRNPAPFTTEGDCQHYLQACFRRADFRCPSCGERGGSWLASRARWQCRACRRQFGPRVDTIMAGSRLPLLKWFNAIRAILLDPEICTAEFCDKTAITRAATARRLAARIRAALATPNATQLLAGLDRHFLGKSRSC